MMRTSTNGTARCRRAGSCRWDGSFVGCVMLTGIDFSASVHDRAPDPSIGTVTAHTGRRFHSREYRRPRRLDRGGWTAAAGRRRPAAPDPARHRTAMLCSIDFSATVHDRAPDPSIGTFTVHGERESHAPEHHLRPRGADADQGRAEPNDSNHPSTTILRPDCLADLDAPAPRHEDLVRVRPL